MANMYLLNLDEKFYYDRFIYEYIYMVIIINKDIFLRSLSHLHLQMKELFNRNSY